jgi:hypothetical protein
VAIASQIKGEMTYKTPSEELVDRVVTIEVPSTGQGEVIL